MKTFHANISKAKRLTLSFFLLVTLVSQGWSDTEPNDVCAQAEAMSMSGLSTLSGSLQPNGQNDNDDYYTFTADATGILSLTIDVSKNTMGYLYGASCDAVAPLVSSTSSSSIVLSTTVNSNQLYYLRLKANDNGNNSYRTTSSMIPKAPISDWRFDECLWNGTAGEVKDSSRNNYNGTALNGANTFQNSKLMNGGDFNNTSSTDAVDFGRPDLNLTNQMTVMAWVNWQILPSTGAAWANIVSYNSSSSSDKHSFTLQHDSTNNKFEFAVTTGTNTRKYATSTVTTQQNTWQHVVGVYDGNKLIVYVNGVPSTATMSQSGTIIQPPADAKLQIGQWAYATAPRNFKGYLDEIKIFDRALSASEITTFYNNENTGKNYDGSTRMSSCGICQNIKSTYATTTDGYYFVNEATAAVLGLKPFEIYCQDMNTSSPKPYLPTVINQSNSANSNFKFNAISNSNYYTSTNKTYFSKIRVDENISAHSDFLTQGFSNINLIGTPFKVDMTNTTLATCDSAGNTSKLRMGNFDQAIKIDPKVETKTYCTASKMKFTQIPNYYAKDSYQAKTTCAQIAQSESSRPPSGYYLLKKVKQTAGESQHIVAYCEMNPPVEKQIWTMFLALDGQTTDQKSDVVNGNDTCSQVGYSFFAPNRKETMEAIRLFLYNFKSDWSDYAGTVREYFSDYGITGWATDSQASEFKPNPIPDGAMWPYGPFGIYKTTGSGGNVNNKKMAMSRKYLSAIDINDSFGSLEDTEWKSILPEINSDYANAWWVADIAAGYKRNVTTGRLVPTTPQAVEPNGDYNANNWLGWFSDANGYIIHYNDQSGGVRYRYSNYMCTSKDVYQTVETTWDTSGFDAWDTDRTILQKGIVTKKASENFKLTIAALKSDDVNTLDDFNGTVCVQIVDDQNVTLNGVGTKVSFTGQQTVNTSDIAIAKAVKDARVKLSWKANVNQACPVGDSNATLASDNFSIRPISYVPTSSPTPKAGEVFTLSLKAVGNASATIAGYDATVPLVKSIYDANKICSVADGNLTTSASGAINSLIFQTADSSSSNQLIFGDIGKFTLNLKDTTWTQVDQAKNQCITDSNTTVADASGEIGCNIENNITITVKPHHFDINASLKNFNNATFTYLANPLVEDVDRNMSALLDYNITALNALGGVTKNYTNGCYAYDTTHTVNYVSLAVEPSNALTLLKYYETNTSKEGNVSTNLTTFSISHSKDIFTTTNPGTSTLNYKLNFDRNSSKPVNPLDLNISKVTISEPNVEGNDTSVGNARFYYGRIKTKDITTDQADVNHSLHVEVYSTKPLSGFYQNTLNWWVNANDGVTKGNDLNATAYKNFAKTSLPNAPQIASFANLSNGISSFMINNPNKVKSAIFHLEIPSWLWYSTIANKDYNASGDCSYHPCFEYRFIDNASSTIGIKSGTFKGSTIGDGKDFNATYQKTGVKTFR